MSQGRRFHKNSRLSENFTETGLQQLTGERPSYWARYVVKELLDNSLEAAEGYAETPQIDIEIETNDSLVSKVTKVVVTDNGPGIAKEDMAAIFEDISAFAGSKRHYCLPTRGNQGNALMTILGIQNLSDDPLVVETDGTRHNIQVVQSVMDEWQIEHKTEPSDIEGTRITVDFCKDNNYNLSMVEPTLGAFVALNPHVHWEAVIGGTEWEFEAADSPSAEQFTLSKKATTGKAIWFSYDGFKERLKADARADPSLTVNDVVSEFAKLSSANKRSSVFDGIEGYRNQPLNKFLREQSDDERRKLHERMVAETSTYSERSLDSTLGSVGGDLTHGLYNYLRFIGEYDSVESLAARLSDYSDDIQQPEDITIYYSDGAVVESEDMDKATPFNFELVAVPKPNESADTELEFGINQSVSYSSRPGISVEFSANGQEYRNPYVMGGFNSATEHPYYIVTNLTCPNIDFQDKGKQQFDPEPFQEAVSNVVRKAVGKVQRDIRPRLNDLRSMDVDESEDEQELSNKMPTSYKEFIYSNFDEIYNESTEGGQYAINKHQFYYDMREELMKVAKREGWEYAPDATPENPKELELKKGTFNTHIDSYETEVLGERVLYRDKRGFFVEPHTNESVDLQTSTVRRYQPPAKQFNNILFVEKTGFYELIHKQFELTKKYDIGLINAKGYNSNAARNLVETIQTETDATLYILSDLDVDGLNIASNATKSDDVSSFGPFDAERIGVAVGDVEQFGLSPEPVNYSDDKLTQLENLVESGTVTDDTADFLTENGGQRVEINALSPSELKDYLVEKIEKLGVEKVKPDESDIDDPEMMQQNAIAQAVGEWVLSETRSELVNQVEETLESEDTSRKEIQSRIRDELDSNPPKGWQDIEQDIQNDISKEWREKAREHLKENATVEVELD